MRTRRRIGLVALALVVSLGAAAGGSLLSARFAARDVVGSATEEFVPVDPPVLRLPQPGRVQRTTVGWGLWGAGPERTRVSPYPHRPPYEARWSFRAQSLVEFAPVIGHETLYFANNEGVLFAVNSRTGKVRWRRETGRVQAAASALVGRTLYHTFMYRQAVGKSDPTGEVIALDALTGDVQWKRAIAPSESSPLVQDGIVYVGDWSGRVHALDAGTGRTRWEFRADGPVKGALAAAGDRLFVGSYDSHLYSLDARSGKVLWRASAQDRLGVRGRFYSTPAVAYGRVYIGATDGKVYAFAAATGELRWSRSTGAYVYGSPAVWDGRVYVGSWDRNVYALDAATGEVVWRFAAGGAISGSATVVDGLVYVSTLGRVTVALDARTGEERWRFPDGRYAGVVADARKLYLVGTGRVYAFRSVGPPAPSVVLGETSAAAPAPSASLAPSDPIGP